MNNLGILKFILLIFIVNFFDLFAGTFLIKYFVVIPLTFLFFSFYVYRQNQNVSPMFSFLIGIIVDLISYTFIGLNGCLFCLMTYIINNYSNTFKLFSYFQICIFFGLSAAFYVGFSHLFLNLGNFSYLTLFLSAILNTLLFIIITMINFYLPTTFKRKN